MHDHYDTYDLVGAIIDGVRYGITSDAPLQPNGSTNNLGARIVDGGTAIAVTPPAGMNGPADVLVVDLLGRTVAKGRIDADARSGGRLLIWTAGLPAGPYFIVLRDGMRTSSARVLLTR